MSSNLERPSVGPFLLVIDNKTMRTLLIAAFTVASVAVLLFTVIGGGHKQSQGIASTPKATEVAFETPETNNMQPEPETKLVTGTVPLTFKTEINPQ